VGAQGVCDLHGGCSNATVRPRDQNSFTGDEVALGDQGIVGRGEGFGEAACFSPTDIIGDEDEVLGRHQAVRSLSPAADNRTDTPTQQWFGDSVTDRTHDAGHLQTRNIDGRSRGGWIEALPLEQVSGIDARRAHAHHNVVGTRLGGRTFNDFQISISDNDCLHVLQPTGDTLGGCADRVRE
jgi:hypothetical protein